MAINLEEHVIVHSGIKFVPLTIAQKAVEEAFSDVEAKVDEAMTLINNSLTQLNKTISEND